MSQDMSQDQKPQSQSTDAPIAETNQSRSSSSRLKKVLVPLGIVFVALILVLLLAIMAPKPEKKNTERKPTLVEVIEPVVSTARFTVLSQGNLLPRTETTLISEVSGTVKRVSDKFVVGGYFNKGELMLEIDPINYEVALLQSQARLDAANAKLVEEKARSEQAQKEWDLTGRSRKKAPILALRVPQLSQAKADVKAAEADVKSAQLKLEKTKIKAPYDAMIREKMVDIGQYVTVGAQLAKSFAVDYAEVRLPIKPLDLDVIKLRKPGQNDFAGIEVDLRAIQGRKIVNRASFISRQEGVIDTSSRVSYLVAQVNDPYGLSENQDAAGIPVGSFVYATITADKAQPAIKLPRQVLHPGNKIYLASKDNKLKVVTVEPARIEHNFIFLEAGSIAPNQSVILTNIVNPVNGMQLRLADAKNKANHKPQAVVKSVRSNRAKGEKPVSQSAEEQGANHD